MSARFPLVAMAAMLVSGCAAITPDGGFDSVAQVATERLGKDEKESDEIREEIITYHRATITTRVLAHHCRVDLIDANDLDVNVHLRDNNNTSKKKRQYYTSGTYNPYSTHDDDDDLQLLVPATPHKTKV